MRRMGLVLIISAVVVSAWTIGSLAEADVLGPLPYENATDSPFNLSRLRTDFFIEEFNQPIPVFYRELPPYGIRFPFASLSTPGVEVEGQVGWTGSALSTHGACTDAIPPSCISSMKFSFDASELGLLPEAVGVVLGGFGRFSLQAYDAHNQLVETAMAEFDLSVYLAEHQPPPNEIIALPPPARKFLGVTHTDGISYVVIHSHAEMFALDDFQYGKLIPEPSSVLLSIAAVFGLVAFCGRTLWIKGKRPSCHHG